MEKKYIFIEHFQDENNKPVTRHIYEMPEEEFAQIAPANATVFEVFRLEELFATLIDNFFEFNNVILSYAEKARILSKGNYFQKRIDVNRAALNFFATLNMYRDFVKEHVDDTDIIDYLDVNKAFQRCLVMRNYIQHVDFFPIISHVSYTRCDINVMLASVRFQIEATKLKIDQLRKTTIENFQKYFLEDEKIDLYEIINQGMDEIRLIQSKIRKIPLYTVDYAESRAFLRETKKKIFRNDSATTGIPLYYESDGDKNDLTPCFLATDTIKFVDDNIKRYNCQSSNANNYITTAPEDFLKKCSNKIFSPAVNQRLREEAQERLKRNPDA